MLNAGNFKRANWVNRGKHFAGRRRKGDSKVSFLREEGTRELFLHATKGYRSYAPASPGEGVNALDLWFSAFRDQFLADQHKRVKAEDKIRKAKRKREVQRQKRCAALQYQLA